MRLRHGCGIRIRSGQRRPGKVQLIATEGLSMIQRTACTMILIPLLWLTASSAFGAESADVARIDAAASSYVVFATAVTLVKITALVTGYLVVRLGDTTMMAGVQGKDSAELSLAGAKIAQKMRA